MYTPAASATSGVTPKGPSASGMSPMGTITTALVRSASHTPCQ